MYTSTEKDFFAVVVYFMDDDQLFSLACSVFNIGDPLWIMTMINVGPACHPNTRVNGAAKLYPNNRSDDLITAVLLSTLFLCLFGSGVGDGACPFPLSFALFGLPFRLVVRLIFVSIFCLLFGTLSTDKCGPM